MHVYTFSFTASGWTSLLYPEMLFVWKAESQGEIHFHYTDNQRADQHHTLQKTFLSPSLILCTYLQPLSLLCSSDKATLNSILQTQHM